MKHTLLEEFISLVEKYERGLDPCHNDDAIRAVDNMAEWVEDNRNALECESIEDIFEEYEDMLSYSNGGYLEHMFPNGDDEDGYMENGHEDAEGEETGCIRKFRRFCSVGE